MKPREHERRDSGIIIILILLLGFICIILASGWALRFAPSWRLTTNMGSNLDPNSDFLTSKPASFIEPLDSAILTNPAWINVFLTPGASFETRTPLPTGTSTSVPPKTSTPIPSPTASPTLFVVFPTVIITNTNTPVVIEPTSTDIATGTAIATATATSTVTATQTATSTSTATETPTATLTFTPVPVANLQITKTDNATDYDAGISVQYIIVASNPVGPSGVTGATVTDIFSTNLDLTSITWTCAGSGGASCTANGVGNINDTVNLPVLGSVTYTVNATVIASPSGPLINTATVSVPAGITDPNLLNNSATDTDQLVVSNSFPYGNIGVTPDGSAENIPAGTYLILQFGTPLVVGGHASYDLVYYPDPLAPTLQMDVVILQVGDGSNWYTILNWGNGSPDTNTDIPAFPPNPTDCTGEPDNCVIDPSLLANSPGISINLDGVMPNGTYNYIRIFSRSNPPDSGDGVDVDAISILP